jgi:hypothetical protein
MGDFMKNVVRSLAAVAVMMVVAAPVQAQRFHGGHTHEASSVNHDNTRLHINTRWKECSFQLNAALTQEAWRQFTGEAGVVAYFRPLVDAKPMGRGKYEISLLKWSTGIDDTDAAWNDTFVHPDSTHWLFEGSALQFPGLTARVGVTEGTDVGLYFTKSPGANYGFYGVQVQQTLLPAESGPWGAAARLSYSALHGPEDLEFGVMGADLLVSRRIGLFGGRVAVSPYAGLSGTLSRSHEKSAVVNLKDENVWGSQTTIGATAEFSVMRVGMEYSAAKVQSMSLKIGFGR